MKLTIGKYSGSLMVVIAISGGILSTAKTNGAIIFNSFNGDGVGNNPSILPVFTLSNPMKITLLEDYHWAGGAGSNPAGQTISIYDASSNTLIGSWAAFSEAYSPPNTYWGAYPNIVLGPGSYQIVDSDRATWSYSLTDFVKQGNDWEPGKGFTKVTAVPVPEPATCLAGLAALGLLGLRAMRSFK